MQVKPPSTMPRAGDRFSVTVELTGNPGFCAAQFTLAFDSAAMVCEKAEVGPLLSETLYVTNPEATEGAIVGAATTIPVTTDGVLATLTFRATADVKDYGFVLLDPDLANVDGDPIAFSMRVGDAAPVEVPVNSPTPTIPSGEDGVRTGEDETTATTGSGQETRFSDTANHWGAAYISKAVELGLFHGYADGSFQPDRPISRAQFMAVLYRMAGSPAENGSTPFSDIAGQSAEFRSAIAWGYRHGYIGGKAEGLFDPDGNLTRQEAMKILFSYAGEVSGVEAMFTGIYDDEFPDSGEIASWAKPGMYWAVYHEIIGGSDVGLEPGASTTRAQMSKILVNYVQKYQEG